jgi:hypothetical protein
MRSFYRLHVDLLRVTLEVIYSTMQAWPISAAVRGDSLGTEWIFPIVETLHVITLTLVFGSIGMLDLRLIGVAFRDRAVTQLAGELLPWTWTAWSLAAVFGTLMFISKASTYAHNLQFRLKFACMGLAALNMVVFHFGAYRNARRWEGHEAPWGAKLAGSLSLLLWIGVVFFGRWTGFTT